MKKKEITPTPHYLMNAFFFVGFWVFFCFFDKCKTCFFCLSNLNINLNVLHRGGQIPIYDAHRATIEILSDSLWRTSIADVNDVVEVVAHGHK